MKTSRPEALIFDLDGTLFKTETLSLPAYHRTFNLLRAEGKFSGDTPPEELFLSSLGLLLPEIWQKVLPDASEEIRQRANELLLNSQIELLHGGCGELYPGVKDTLQKLRFHNYKLYVASNGLEAYVKGVMDAMGLSPLFTALYSAGEFHTSSKAELVGLLLKNHPFETAWMCGDRLSDIEAGVKNSLFVVGCSYGGFHQSEELAEADLVVDSFPALLNHLPN